MSVEFILILFFSFIAILFLVSIVKKMYFWFVKKKRYFIIPRVSTTGICNIGMVLALSISVILLLIVATAGIASTIFRLWAGTRIIFEGILIKIGGLFFGPIIGMCLGAATDLLTITYSGGIFHYGYFISAMLFGLFGGVIRKLVVHSKSLNLRFNIFATIFTALIVCFSGILIYVSNQNSISNYYELSLMGFRIMMSFKLIIALVVGIPIIGISIMWLVYLIYLGYAINCKKKKKEPRNWYKTFAPVFVLILISELIVNILFMPAFDCTISPLPYEAWLAIRILLYAPMVALNLVVILPVYKIVSPLLKYKYEDDMYIDRNIPLQLE